MLSHFNLVEKKGSAYPVRLPPKPFPSAGFDASPVNEGLASVIRD